MAAWAELAGLYAELGLDHFAQAAYSGHITRCAILPYSSNEPDPCHDMCSTHVAPAARLLEATLFAPGRPAAAAMTSPAVSHLEILLPGHFPWQFSCSTCCVMSTAKSSLSCQQENCIGHM